MQESTLNKSFMPSADESLYIEPEPGIWTMEMADYLMIDAVSKSGLAEMSISMKHFIYSLTHRKYEKKMDVGTVAHTALIESWNLANQLVLQPATIKQRRGKEWDKFQQANIGKIILTGQQYADVLGMVESARAHPEFKRYLSEGQPEVTAIWEDPESGVMCKTRPDYLCKEPGTITHIKTTQSRLLPGKIAHIAADMKYHWSAKLSEVGMTAASDTEHNKSVFFFLEQTAPYGCRIWEIDRDAVEYAWYDIVNLLFQYKIFRDSNHWPGYTEDLTTLYLPKWAYKKEMIHD